MKTEFKKRAEEKEEAEVEELVNFKDINLATKMEIETPPKPEVENPTPVDVEPVQNGHSKHQEVPQESKSPA